MAIRIDGQNRIFTLHIKEFHLFGCTLKELAERIAAEGMKFDIWLEPEGISEDSNL